LPVIRRNRVVLPDPFGPTRPTFSPFSRAVEASMKTIWWPFCLPMLSRRIIAGRARTFGEGAGLSACGVRGEGHPNPSRSGEGEPRVSAVGGVPLVRRSARTAYHAEGPPPTGLRPVPPPRSGEG